MEWNKLSNANIIFLYLENLDTLEQFERVIKDKGIKSEVDIPLFGKSIHIHPVSDDTIKDMLSSVLLKNIKEVNSILEPIVDLIRDSDPELYKQVEEATNVTFNI